MNKNIISYDKKGFIINGKREFLIGGEFHYFRVPSAQWEDRLEKMRSTGANLISVYIAWNMHEPEEGREIWEGDYDLQRFLYLCKKCGFYVLIKPGPYICAELDFGGHPDWLIAKVAKKEFRIRMLDQKYLDLCRRWYKTVSEKINPFLITNGGTIIAAQIENEYDHLIEYGEETITVQDAIDYLMYLKNVMEEYGINVPKFANEAAFLRGKGVIDTRTYYPNIPGQWMYEFDAFEGKILDSKKSQNDSPVMILELQAGWFSQIGVPTYEPDLTVVEGVSKSVLIQGASIINYYMMVGGTTFPFMGARGDVIFLGGLGNITSYDFGGSPIRETGELHNDKYNWIKGFIRFAKEFNNIILDSDGKRFTSITAGGEKVALLSRDGAKLDYRVDLCNENFKIYEEGTKEGRFVFLRNLEAEAKLLSINISSKLLGKEVNFKAKVEARETKMLPIAFKIPDTNIMINYATSEVLLSKKYDRNTSFVMYGKSKKEGEIGLNVSSSDICVIKGEVKVNDTELGCLLQFTHDDIIIIKVNNLTLFVIEEGLIGSIDEMKYGLSISEVYYISKFEESDSGIEFDMQVKSNSKNKVRFYPMVESVSLSKALLCGENISLAKNEKENLYSINFESGSFPEGPEFNWTSNWKYCGDTNEIDDDFNIAEWTFLSDPISLEEAGFIEHGYYWYKAKFDLENDPGMIFMDYVHNDTDRMFIYINGELVYKSHNRKIEMKNITKVLQKGTNDITILYANEFHNKSHPHEGAIVKYSGIMNPFIIHGSYSDDSECNIEVKSFYLKKGLLGMNKGYTTFEYDDSNWFEAPNVEKLVTEKELGYIVWFRRKFKYDIEDEFNSPIIFKTKEADQRLTIYVNGKAVARYDILGPQEEFYIPEAFLNNGGENVISIILEGPAFYDESQSGYRRGYIYSPEINQVFKAKKHKLMLLCKNKEI